MTRRPRGVAVLRFALTVAVVGIAGVASCDGRRHPVDAVVADLALIEIPTPA